MLKKRTNGAAKNVFVVPFVLVVYFRLGKYWCLNGVEMMICDNLTIGENGHLFFAGQDTVDLAKQYGTPLYLMDEDKMRSNCREYKEAMAAHFGDNSLPLYASKACCFKRLYEIMQEEDMGIDVVSPGEIYVAVSAGFNMSNAFFHGNNKTDDDISFAMEHGVGYFVVDNDEEVLAVEQEAAKRGLRQKVILRLTPGIDPHTFAAVATGKIDSKFGNAIATGAAEEITVLALKQKHLDVQGFHCHVGSQVFTSEVFEQAAEIMLQFIAEMKKKYAYEAKVLDLGGGYGVRYSMAEPEPVSIREKIAKVAARIDETCAALNITKPRIFLEPGRSIAADAGITLYTAGTVKRIAGYKNYVSIDGSMSDNPRYALYKSVHTCLAAGKMTEKADFKCSLVGRCCESGDIIQEDILLPESIRRGDVIAVCTTGAYNYAMASNYNMLTKPPVVMLRNGENYVAVKRETFAQMTANFM